MNDGKHTQNKFRRVIEPDSESVTVTLFRNGKHIRADVAGPVQAGREMLTPDVMGQDGNLPVPNALNMAITLATRHKVKIVVRDENNLWKKEWGELV
jgi:hypothetical protein